VTPVRDPAASRTGIAICSDLLTSASVRMTLDMLPLLRQRPGPGMGESLPAAFLRHADEQTVAGLAAVLHAIPNCRMGLTDFRDWGIVAAPCFLGRATLAVALQRLAVEGAWGISPHFIPHHSQHATSGTISQVLKIYGPNLGAGGGPGGLFEALLAGSVLLDTHRLPGVWVIVSEWEPEAIPDENGGINPDTACHAVALALVTARLGCRGVRLRVLPRGGTAGSDPDPNQSRPRVSQFSALLQRLAQEKSQPAQFAWPLGGGTWIELSRGERGTPGTRPTKMPWSSYRIRVEVQPNGAGTENIR
jgi:hypothetical protein